MFEDGGLSQPHGTEPSLAGQGLDVNRICVWRSKRETVKMEMEMEMVIGRERSVRSVGEAEWRRSFWLG